MNTGFQGKILKIQAEPAIVMKICCCSVATNQKLNVPSPKTTRSFLPIRLETTENDYTD